MAKELTELEKHYNKFNEEKRLGRRQIGRASCRERG